jgi:hypothetical protein
MIVLSSPSELMSWMEDQRVDFVLGFARNPRLRALLAPQLAAAALQFEQTQKPARVFAEFPYQTTTGSWQRERRVVAKAEHLDGNRRAGLVHRFAFVIDQGADARAYLMVEDKPQAGEIRGAGAARVRRGRSSCLARGRWTWLGRDHAAPHGLATGPVRSP